MTGKQVFQVLVGAASVAALAAAGLTYKEVSYGAAEMTPAGGAITGVGGVAGIIGFLYSLLTVGKDWISGLSSGKQDPLLSGGLAILQSLMSGKQDAIGLTKHAAVAILFADRAAKSDLEGLAIVMSLAKRCLSDVPVVDPPKQAA